MSEKVLRYAKPLDMDHLQGVLEGATWPAEPLPSGIELDPVVDAIDGLPAGAAGTELDKLLVEPLHRALAGMTRRQAADMRVWHWLAVRFEDHVWRRWKGGKPLPDQLGPELGVAMSRRFLGKSSLNGVSRNSFARLWWTAEELRDGDDYGLARKALENQDMFQAIFERFFGIYPDAAMACLDRFDDRTEGERRAAARWLQQCLSTTVLEVLPQDEVRAILDEAFPAT